jgi:phosphoadenosine phosphosulfate reductase
MKLDDSAITGLNATFGGSSPGEMIRWAHSTSPGRVVVSTNFRPYEAVILHAVTRVIPDVPVLWVDHGYNRAATYLHAEDLRARLGLNIKPYLPAVTVAHREAVHGPVPSLDDEAGLKAFSATMKIEPFRRGMRELAPAIWITGLRRVQNPGRAMMAFLENDANFGTLKLSPFLDWTDAQMEAYLEEHALPNEWDYFDPAKADEKRECGLHAPWARDTRAQDAGSRV